MVFIQGVLKNKINHILSTILLILFSISSTLAQQVPDKKNDQDSIFEYIKYSKDKQKVLGERKDYIEKARALSLLEKNDSLRNKYFSEIALAYLKLDDSLNFRKFNAESIRLSKKVNDSLTLANNYWDLATLYSNKDIKDSSFYQYFQAYKMFIKAKDSSDAARTLLGMAEEQADLEDFTGSEITTVEAIKIFKSLNDNSQLYDCYNQLGINYNQLGEYQQSLFYHEEALKYLKKAKDPGTRERSSLNNIGVVYENMGDHANAVENFKKALEYDNLEKKNPESYARILDNLAYSRLKLQDTLGIYKLFNKALHIRDSMNNYGGVAINKLHLVEYYLYKKDTAKAVEVAKEVVSLTTERKNYRDKLSALKVLSSLEKDYKYGEEYIKLNDSLIKAERSIRNKFARIKFETDEYIEKTEELSQQKKLILITSGIIVILGSLVFIIINQRIRNKKLQLEQDQQKANEEIYNLMLSQQKKVDEGRRREKKRISEELHDGVLGKLFGTRLILGTLNTSVKKEDVNKREQYIQDLQEIEEEIRNVSHELNDASQASDIGYISLIESMFEKQSEISGFTYSLKADTNLNWEGVEGNLKMNLYRIIQEAIQNINKYARAKNVKIVFKHLDTELLQLTIEDDGVGFDMTSKNKGIGLKNMHSRAEKIKGTLDIETVINQGTRIIVRAPLSN